MEEITKGTIIAFGCGKVRAHIDLCMGNGKIRTFLLKNEALAGKLAGKLHVGEVIEIETDSRNFIADWILGVWIGYDQNCELSRVAL
jgi:hypothetical protein